MNTNADTIASEIGAALAPYFKVDLYYCFDKEGVLQDIDNPNSIISHINTQDYQVLKKTGSYAVPAQPNEWYRFEQTQAVQSDPTTLPPKAWPTWDAPDLGDSVSTALFVLERFPVT